MKLGTFKHVVAIQRATTTGNALNEPVQTWSTICETWASVRPLAGREFLAAQQVVASVSHEVRMRWIDGVRVTDRVLFDGRAFDIKAVLNIDEADRELVLMCTEHGV